MSFRTTLCLALARLDPPLAPTFDCVMETALQGSVDCGALAVIMVWQGHRLGVEVQGHLVAGGLNEDFDALFLFLKDLVVRIDLENLIPVYQVHRVPLYLERTLWGLTIAQSEVLLIK